MGCPHFLSMALLLFMLLLLQESSADRCQNVICGGSLEACYDTGTHGSCECKPGYYRTPDRTCERDCDSNYCYYGAKCERGSTGRACRCTKGYTGIRCDKEGGINIRIAIGSSVAACVLVVFMAAIFCQEKREESTRKGRWAEFDKANEASQLETVREPASAKAAENGHVIEIDEQRNSCSSADSAHSFSNEAAEISVKEDEEVFKEEEDSAL